MADPHLPLVLVDDPLPGVVTELLQGRVQCLPWNSLQQHELTHADAIYTYGHPTVDGKLLDRLTGVRVISNHGVGVDHIELAEATRRGIPVGNTPHVLDGATADMGFALLLAAARRLVRGDHFARSPEFLHYDPGYLLGREVHGQTIGIVGLGRIGLQIARRASGFDMRVLYHNRRPRTDLPESLQASYRDLDCLLEQSDFVVICVPLSKETERLIDHERLAKMKSTAILINIARGAVVDTDALTEAVLNRRIDAAALDVTYPEPLPRDHPLLQSEHLVIAPHLGSATEQTRRVMAELSIDNLMRGLNGQPLVHQVN
jgi:glyoxylate reductase